MSAQSHTARSRRGFTLVEMLTVVVIIGILAGLITAAAYKARQAALQATIKSEISQLKAAIEDYKTQIGEYPPDFVGVQLAAGNTAGDNARAAVVRHLRLRFRRFVLSGANTNAQFNNFASYLSTNYGINPAQFDAASALVFWLGGLPKDPNPSNPADPSVLWRPEGFHTDPTNPFRVGPDRTEPMFKFDTDRFRCVDTHATLTGGTAGYLRYYPRDPENGAPYVYFRPQFNTATSTRIYCMVGTSGPEQLSWQTAAGLGLAVPYQEPTASGGTKWRADDTFQIISAGLDANFGTSDVTTARVSKTGVGFTEGDHDNLTSFAEGRLEAEIQ